MQRKNNFLKKSLNRSRNAMAMIMAIAVIIIISTIMALSLSMTTQTTKRTIDAYLHEQAILVSKSVAERTLLSIAQSAPCSVTAINERFDLNNDGSTTDDIFDVNVTIRYVYTDYTICTNPNDNYFSTAITTNEQNGSVLMDITVTTDESLEPIRYFRRSIQKL